MDQIDHLEVGIVPHRDWARRRWFYANTLWYYHRPAEQHRLNTNPRFYELVDPDLRELCRAFHESGILTTPSCQGHFYPRARFEHIWHELRLEAVRVRDHGLAVKDAESDEPAMFRDGAYHLPWESFDAFYAVAGPHQNTGFIGFVLPGDHPAARRLADGVPEIENATIAADAELSKQLGGPTYAVTVRTASPERQSAAWQAVTGTLTKLIAA